MFSVEQRSHLLSHLPPHFSHICVQDGGSLTQKTLTPEHQSHLAVQGLNTERVVVVKRKWLREFMAEIKVRGGRGWVEGLGRGRGQHCCSEEQVVVVKRKWVRGFIAEIKARGGGGWVEAWEREGAALLFGGNRASGWWLSSASEFIAEIKVKGGGGWSNKRGS